MAEAVRNQPVGGVEDFFEEITRVLEAAQRQFGIANEQYTRYTVERLQGCIRSLSILLENLVYTQVSLTDDEQRTLDTIKSSIEDLLECCRTIESEWDNLLDMLMSHMSTFSYHAPFVETATRRRGRPRFDIEKDQLVYLSSMGFSWTNIAKILGVTRMTVYRRRRELGVLGINF